MKADVPQGSVLGPVLWNIAFDSVIRLAEDEEFGNIICYADDTLVVVTGRNLLHTKIRASVFASKVINHIQRLGLEVAAEKTEAIIFHPKKVSEDIPRSIFINGVAIDPASSIKLGRAPRRERV